MAFERAFITLTLAVDIDPVPGAWDNPDDWERYIQRQFECGVYRPVLTFHDTTVKRYRWDEDAAQYAEPDAPTVTVA